jgi:hypothetical protein
MILRITKIIDEMLDLETGEQFSHGVVVSNGIHEHFIPLTKEALQPLVMLYAELVEAKQPVPSSGNGATEQQTPLLEKRLPAPEAMHGFADQFGGTDEGSHYMAQTAVGPTRGLEESARTAPVLIDPRHNIQFTPEETPPDDAEGFEPGEEYEDELTGVSSF